MKVHSTKYYCPTCKMRTVQPSRTADAGTVYCTLIAKHKDNKNRIMKKVTNDGLVDPRQG